MQPPTRALASYAILAFAISPEGRLRAFLTPELTCRRSDSPGEITYASKTHSPARNKDAGRRRQVQRALDASGILAGMAAPEGAGPSPLPEREVVRLQAHVRQPPPLVATAPLRDEVGIEPVQVAVHAVLARRPDRQPGDVVLRLGG